jgi:hypothetical protein
VPHTQDDDRPKHATYNAPTARNVAHLSQQVQAAVWRWRGQPELQAIQQQPLHAQQVGAAEAVRGNSHQRLDRGRAHLQEHEVRVHMKVQARHEALRGNSHLVKPGQTHAGGTVVKCLVKPVLTHAGKPVVNLLVKPGQTHATAG